MKKKDDVSRYDVTSQMKRLEVSLEKRRQRLELELVKVKALQERLGGKS